MLIKKSQAHRKQGAPSTIVREYDFPNKELWFAVAHMNGRYPETGKVINHECAEMYYILSWEWIIHDETGDHEVKEWDCYLFEKGKRYRVEGKEMKIALPTSPTWTPEQYENIK